MPLRRQRLPGDFRRTYGGADGPISVSALRIWILVTMPEPRSKNSPPPRNRTSRRLRKPISGGEEAGPRPWTIRCARRCRDRGAERHVEPAVGRAVRENPASISAVYRRAAERAALRAFSQYRGLSDPDGLRGWVASSSMCDPAEYSRFTALGSMRSGGCVVDELKRTCDAQTPNDVIDAMIPRDPAHPRTG